MDSRTETNPQKGHDAEKKLKDNSLKISIKEGSAYSFMEGFGLRYITPYALALGATNVHIGFLSSLPNLIGNISQLFALKIMSRVSRKSIVMTGVFAQSFMWLPIIFVGMLYFMFGVSSVYAVTMLIAFYMLLVVSGAIAGPAWTSWMRDLIHKNRGKYFGMRNRICGAIAIAAALIAGYVLDLFKDANSLFIGFVVLFVVAFAGRLASGLFFIRQHEPEFKFDSSMYFSFFDFVRNMLYNNFGRFAVYASLIYFGTAIASPFFAVYMLNELKFNYTLYTIVILVSSIASIASMPAWGKFVDIYGSGKTLKMTGLFISFIPLLWLATPFIAGNLWALIPYLVIAEAFGGFVWAGFGLASTTFIYDAVTVQRTALCSAYFSLLNNIGVFAGALIGGFLSSTGISFLGFKHILFIFLVSGIVRLAMYFIMVSRFKEVREVKPIFFKEAMDKIAGLSRQQMIRIIR
ncbi:MFS transporter [Candidatus Woesearchaeota archaeon]|nr:MFS transporter [Candidatus Woesearchaeota archaeon]